MSQYSLWLLERPPFSFPLLSTPSSHDAVQQFRKFCDLGPFGVSSWEDWTNVWRVWDFRKARDSPFAGFSAIAYRSETHMSPLTGSHLNIPLSNLLQEANT